MKRIQLEPWTTWEKLCLVNAVQRTGDQNWTAVSRAVKNIYDDTAIPLSNDMRPQHWFSMKQCAAQYETLLNHVLGSRRKKRTERSCDTLETPPDIIYNVLKNELLEEIDRKMEEERIQYKKLRKKHDDILAGLYDDILEEMLLREDSKEKEKDIKLKLKFKLGEKNAAERNVSPIKTTFIPNNSKVVELKLPGSSTSPLLTSLLQSPSQHSLPSVPSISLLLNSPASTLPSNESPTLTKLLESPSSKVPAGAGSNVDVSQRPSPVRPQHPPWHPQTPPSSSSSAIVQIDVNTSPVGPKFTTQRPSPVKEAIEKKKEGSPKIEKSVDDDVKPQVLFQDKQFSTDPPHVVESEIIIEEDIHHDQIKMKESSKSHVEVIEEEEEEVTESVEEILEKLKVSIIETVGGGNDSDDQEEVVGGDHQIDDDPTDDHHHRVVNLGEAKGSDDEAEDDSMITMRKKEEDSSSPSSRGGKEDSCSSPQMTTTNDDDESNIETDEQSRSDGQTDEPHHQQQLKQTNQLQNKVKQPDDNTTNDETEDHVQIDLLDQEAVEIIVMGSNSNSVVNVLGQDSSSEDLTQSSGLEEVKDFNQGTPADEESKPSATTAAGSPTKTTGGTMTTTAKTIDDEEEAVKCEEEDDDDSKEEPEKEQSVVKTSSLKDQTDDESGEDSNITPIIKQIQNRNISPSISKEYMPEVMVTLEPIEQMMLGNTKLESKTTPMVEKLKKTRKRSSTQIDSKPSSPASTSFNDDEKEYRAWKKSVLLVFSRIASHKYASVFSKPIIDAAGYQNLIKCPMDLSTIKRNIETGVIRTTMEFQRDVLLMIQNAVMYNPASSFVHNMALEMWSDVINEMNVMVQALGDGVPLGRSNGDNSGSGASAPPTRSGRQAKLYTDKKKQDAANTPKRRRIN